MKIAIAGDSAGEALAHQLTTHLQKKGFEATDLSKPENGAAELYASLSERVALAVKEGRFERAILCCGTGIGVCISANKIPGIRAALTHDTYSAQRAALSNNAQIITMGARVVGLELAKSIAEAWLNETFDPASASAKNVAGIDALDKKYAAPK
ncbi:RpiB/LacA/LacB family sugar-phosphate isomerase [Candidatus Kirkpatrickella diaphorinae]|uniref:RpiB/LacA/LacB family sugar-phosphate isomerase n=1 Tax=Candidatus Kirkpatrickella diaphorinae TaxID=2984322 RepID=A0ABY6GK63_9PROT|nr:RpiB/LacA/LacB family sugar-phosphate isomerase [Candidatus Kirkpatrickella diaphorinae]UYH51932.1 RpiB/LacA/LacB family sugar-phosphate isomerase [Candidatus Kirkpatrickella diaphorinae]